MPAPIIVDEFDKYKQRQQVLELFRTSSRGGQILRGTQDQHGQSFGLNMSRTSQRSNPVTFGGRTETDLYVASWGCHCSAGRLVLPVADELRTLGRQIAAAALWAAKAAVRASAERSSKDASRVYTVDWLKSFAVPAAIDSPC